MTTSLNIRILEKICRTCMEEQETEVIPNATKQKAKSLISIYQEDGHTGSLNIMELLKQTSPQLTVENNDVLPKNICGNCLEMVVHIYEFQKKSLRVEQRLRDIIKEYYSSHEMDTDPLNSNKTEQADGENILKIEINQPVTDVTIPVRGFFTLIQKDGEIVKVYNDFDKSEEHTSGCSEKCDTEDDVRFDIPASEEVNNENDKLTAAMFWKYIDGINEDIISVMEGQNSQREGFINGEVNSSMGRCEQKRKRLYKRTRAFSKANTDKINNRKQESCSEDVDDGERIHQPTIARSNDMKNVTEEESLKSEVSGCYETSVEDDSEWEPPSAKSESFKSKNVKNDTKLEDNQQDNLNPQKAELICDKANTCSFSCNECGKRLKTRPALERHLKIHLKNKQSQPSTNNGHICPECGMRLKTRVTFKRHLSTHEKGEKKIKKRPYLCSICGKSFSSPYNFNQHSELHSTELKYQCPECPKRFKCRSNMTTHKAIVHSTVRPHVCDVCGASFKKPYSLTKHKINHGEKKHKCRYCELKFSHPDQCRRHMRKHTGEKPYKCRYCESSYSQSTEVMKHLRVHLGDNVYRCEMCPKAFRMLCELRVHFNSHKDDDEETKFNNLRALKEEEKLIQAKIENGKATEQRS